MLVKKNNQTTTPESNPARGDKLNISNDKLYEAIKKRAYDLYCKRGYQHGHDVNDWVEAEKQVKRQFGLSR
jgi:hypothetical protein